MSTCKTCNVRTDFARCMFCGGQSCKTFMCQKHTTRITSPSDDVANACEKCVVKKVEKGLWVIIN